MTLSVNILETDSQIARAINKALAKEINSLINKNNNKVLRELREQIRTWVLQTPEISSLLTQGLEYSLNALFGLTPGSSPSAVDAIASSVAEATSITVNKVSERNLAGNIQFHFQPTDFGNLLGLPEGHQLSEEGIDLHWLDWLLTKGDAVIVQGYFYDPQGEGRSGGGTMKLGGSFRVPPEFSGTLDNNFITRVFDDKQKAIESILAKVMR